MRLRGEKRLSEGCRKSRTWTLNKGNKGREERKVEGKRDEELRFLEESRRTRNIGFICLKSQSWCVCLFVRV